MAQITKDISLAKARLDAEHLVAIPTETVYGLAAKGTSTAALQKIFKVKGRPINNPLILHFNDLEAVTPFVLSITDEVKILAKQFWPGPLTFLLPKSNKVPEIVTAGSNRVAVRVPHHKMTLELLERLEYPLAAPSANPSGYISPTLAQHVERQLGNKIDLILDGGPCKGGIESTILGWEDNVPTIYRKGSITAEDIGQVLGTHPQFKKKTEVLEAPGMLTSHYAPTTKTVVTDQVENEIKKNPNQRIGLIVFNKTKELLVEKEVVLSPKASLEEMAKNLYAAMHYMDDLNLDLIVIEKAPDIGIGNAINDRLTRSASE